MKVSTKTCLVKLVALVALGWIQGVLAADPTTPMYVDFFSLSLSRPLFDSITLGSKESC